jgi:hypothetical protein
MNARSKCSHNHKERNVFLYFLIIIINIIAGIIYKFVPLSWNKRHHKQSQWESLVALFVSYFTVLKPMLNFG